MGQSVIYREQNTACGVCVYGNRCLTVRVHMHTIHKATYHYWYFVCIGLLNEYGWMYLFAFTIAII